MNSPPESKFEDSDHSSEDKRRATKMKMRQEDQKFMIKQKRAEIKRIIQQRQNEVNGIMDKVKPFNASNNNFASSYGGYP